MVRQADERLLQYVVMGTSWHMGPPGFQQLLSPLLMLLPFPVAITIAVAVAIAIAVPITVASPIPFAVAVSCLKAYLQYVGFWDVLSHFTFDANLLYIFNLIRAHNIKIHLITTALVALDSIGAFNPCNIL